MFSLKCPNYKARFDETHIIQFICMIVWVLLFSSCEQNVNVEIQTNDKRLLVDGEFTTDSVIHTIKLYRSGSLITGQPQTVVTGAKIYVTDNIETFYYIENKETPGVYQTAGKCCGKGGHHYTLSITNIDIDNDGALDFFTANSMMPVPVKIDSLVSFRGLNSDRNMAVNNIAYYKLYYNGPSYVYKSQLLNNVTDHSLITERLGTGEIARGRKEDKVPKVLEPGSFRNYTGGLSMDPAVVKGDTISFICSNFTTEQFEFLMKFDNATSDKDKFNSESIYDQLKVPTNLPTNIEPAEKAAGYFFIYSVSKISKVFKE